VDNSVPLTHHDLSGLELICLVKKCKIRFQIVDFPEETHLKTVVANYCSNAMPVKKITGNLCSKALFAICNGYN